MPLSIDKRRQLVLSIIESGAGESEAQSLARYAMGIIEQRAAGMAQILAAGPDDSSDGRFLQALIKPVGDRCNLRCRYCFNAPHAQTPVMSLDVLERITAETLKTFPDGVSFSFHGGEALLAGLDFFRAALDFQAKHASPGQYIKNSVQTNGTLITPQWAEFFATAKFKVGVSIDGPPTVHDTNRVDAAGRGSFERVMQGVQHARNAGLNPSVIVVITCPPNTPANELYDFMKASGFNNWRANPCRDTSTNTCYGEYIEQLYDCWVQSNQTMSIAILKETLQIALGYAPSTCAMSGSCSRFIGFEPDGTVSPCCEMSMEPQFHFGNIMHQPLQDILTGLQAQEFWRQHSDGTKLCNGCEWFDFCNGGCTYLRIGAECSPVGKDYLCTAYMDVFDRLTRRIDNALLQGQ